MGNFNQLMNSDHIPFINIDLLIVFYFLELLFGIINQCGKLGSFRRGQHFPIERIHFFSNFSRCVIHYMNKCFIFSVQVTHKMFRSLGQLEQCLVVDNFSRGFLYIRIFFSQQIQIFQIQGRSLSVFFHFWLSCFFRWSI